MISKDAKIKLRIISRITVTCTFNIYNQLNYTINIFNNLFINIAPMNKKKINISNTDVKENN